jgi:hypothetical protein
MFQRLSLLGSLCLSLFLTFRSSAIPLEVKNYHPWETIELSFYAHEIYKNPYTEVELWVDWTGPKETKKVWGFWDGHTTYKIRLVASEAGIWKYTLHSNQNSDKGFINKKGEFKIVAWTAAEIKQNPNRKGFIRPNKNGHALTYADGSPFFMLGDTWLGAATWRLPFRANNPSPQYNPGPGIGFEEAVQFRKKQGFNSVSMISCFPTWEADGKPSTWADSNGIFIRNAWEKWQSPSSNGKNMSKSMADEFGNKPFEMDNKFKYLADYNKIIPAYFSSLDKKIQYLNQEGFVALLESVRRDICPSWKAYSKDFNESYSRFIQYLVARYGAYNLLFSPIHLDWIPKEYSLRADEFNEVLTYHHKKYGGMPFGQPVTVLINNSTYTQFGHDQQCPWLNMHSVGNKPRDHRISAMIDTLFQLQPAYPAINFEPYYTGWNTAHNSPAGERPQRNSERDNYFSRAQMYGSVLSGGLSGHVYGTAAYDLTSTGEPEGDNPHFWEALKYTSGNQMKHLYTFIFSEKSDFQNLIPAHAKLTPQKSKTSLPNGLDGWSYLMQNESKTLAMAYFEKGAESPIISAFLPGTLYRLTWFNPENGKWMNDMKIKSDKNGSLGKIIIPKSNTYGDWALKIKKI